MHEEIVDTKRIEDIVYTLVQMSSGDFVVWSGSYNASTGNRAGDLTTRLKSFSKEQEKEAKIYFRNL